MSLGRFESYQAHHKAGALDIVNRNEGVEAFRRDRRVTLGPFVGAFVQDKLDDEAVERRARCRASKIDVQFVAGGEALMVRQREVITNFIGWQIRPGR